MEENNEKELRKYIRRKKKYKVLVIIQIIIMMFLVINITYAFLEARDDNCDDSHRSHNWKGGLS